jgi:hypothetical protein
VHQFQISALLAQSSTFVHPAAGVSRRCARCRARMRGQPRPKKPILRRGRTSTFAAYPRSGRRQALPNYDRAKAVATQRGVLTTKRTSLTGTRSTPRKFG